MMKSAIELLLLPLLAWSLIGCAAGIGFTVALFVAIVAFPKGTVQDAAKMGALASFSAAGTTLLAAKVLRVGIAGAGGKAN